MEKEVWFSIRGKVLRYSSFEVKLSVTTTDGSPYIILWGDGTSSEHASNTDAIHLYTVKDIPLISFLNKEKIKSLSSNNGIRMNLSETTGMVNLERMWFNTGADVFGNIADLPQSLTSLVLYNAKPGSVVGSYTDLPENIEIIVLRSGNALTGTLAQLPRSITSINVAGGLISGDLKDMPSAVTYVEILSTDMTGDIAYIPETANHFNVQGNNSLYGNLSSLPRGKVGDIQIRSSFNQVVGDISDIPVGLWSVIISGGDSSVYGDITSLSTTMRSFNFPSKLANPIYGDISNIDEETLIRDFTIVGNCNMSYTNHRSWDGDLNTIDIRTNPNSAMPTGDVDLLLEDVSAANWVSTSRTFRIRGSSRSSASDSYVSLLQSKDVNVDVPV